MASRTYLSTRDPGGSTGPLSQAAIIGIACGAGALFTLGTVLFIVYYRQERRFDDEDMQRRRGTYWNSNYNSSWETRSVLPPVEDRPRFTLDYKSGPEPIASRQTSATSRREPSGSLTGVSDGRGIDHMASSMPTHPAYLPRALVRPSRGPPVPTDQFQLCSLPPPQRRGSRPDEFILRAYLAGADGAPAPAPTEEQHDLFPPQQAYEPIDEALPTLASPASTATASTPRTFSRTTRSSRAASSYDEPSEASTPGKLSLLTPGPTLTPLLPPPYAPPTSEWMRTTATMATTKGRGDTPIAGLEDVTISGPLAFADVASGCQRSFRERVAAPHPPPPQQQQHNRRPSDVLRRERGTRRLSARETYHREVRLSVDEEDLFG